MFNEYKRVTAYGEEGRSLCFSSDKGINMDIIVNLIGIAMLFAFLFIIVAIAISEIGKKPWKEEKEK